MSREHPEADWAMATKATQPARGWMAVTAQQMRD
jgi:hypothetical protein